MVRRVVLLLGLVASLAIVAGCDGRIAFADKTGIHTINPDGSDRRTLVPQWGARFPRWSPDGDLLLYEQRNTSSQQGNVPIRMVNADGSGARTLATGYAPQWAPDGKSFIFGVYSNFQTRVYRYVFSTRRSTELAVSPLPIAARIATFRLSRAGTRLVWLESNDLPERSVPGDWLVDANLDGSNRRQWHVDTYYSANLNVFPDDRATYSCSRPDTWSSDVCITDLRNGTTRRMSGPNDFMEADAIESPSGESLLFAGPSGLYTTDKAGKGRKLLFSATSPSANPTDPDWQNVPE